LEAVKKVAKGAKTCPNDNLLTGTEDVDTYTG